MEHAELASRLRARGGRGVSELGTRPGIARTRPKAPRANPAAGSARRPAQAAFDSTEYAGRGAGRGNWSRGGRLHPLRIGAELGENRPGEIEPGRLAGVGERAVPRPAPGRPASASSSELDERARQVRRVGRGAALVVDDADRPACWTRARPSSSRSSRRSHPTPTRSGRRARPGCTSSTARSPASLDAPYTLRGPVVVVRLVGPGPVAREDVVGRDVDRARGRCAAHAVATLRGARLIDQIRALRFALGLVDRRVRGGVDHDADRACSLATRGDRGVDRGRVGDVQVRRAERPGR